MLVICLIKTLLEALGNPMDEKSSVNKLVEDSHVRPPEERISWLLPLMDHIENQVVFGDTKAGLLLAANSFLIAALVAAATGEKPIIADLYGITQGLAIMTFMSITLSIVLALLAIKPCRPNLWISPTPGQSTSSLILFSRIAKQNRVDYINNASVVSLEKVADELASVIYGKATWATHKFQRLYLAVCATLIGVYTGALAVIVESIYRAT